MVCCSCLGDSMVIFQKKKALEHNAPRLWRRQRDSNPRGLSDPNCFQDSLVMTASICLHIWNCFRRNHRIFNFFRNIFRNAVFSCFRSARKVSVYKAFLRFCDLCARKFSRHNHPSENDGFCAMITDDKRSWNPSVYKGFRLFFVRTSKNPLRHKGYRFLKIFLKIF